MSDHDSDTSKSKRKIGVARGGTGQEYPFSLESGRVLLESLRKLGFEPVDFFIDKKGLWHVSGREVAPSAIKEHADLIWHTVHGNFGEDGLMHDILGDAGVEVVGSDAFTSGLTLDKVRTKERLKSIGIQTPKFVGHATSPYEKSDPRFPEVLAKDVLSQMPGPWVVKPVKGGASFGVKLAKSYPELVSAIRDVIERDDAFLVEEYTKGMEVAVGVTDNFRGEENYVFSPMALSLRTEPTSSLERAGSLPWHALSHADRKIVEEVRNLAKEIYRDFGLKGLAEINMIITPKGISVLEIDSVPHLHDGAPIRHAIENTGAKIEDVIGDIIGKYL